MYKTHLSDSLHVCASIRHGPSEFGERWAVSTRASSEVTPEDLVAMGCYYSSVLSAVRPPCASSLGVHLDGVVAAGCIISSWQMMMEGSN